MADYYRSEHLANFGTIAEGKKALATKFFDWCGAVFHDGALSEREKALIALAVAHAVLSQTLARASTARLRTHLLPAWYDVDVEADLHRLARDLADDRTPALRTRSYLLTLARFAGRDRVVDRT